MGNIKNVNNKILKNLKEIAILSNFYVYKTDIAFSHYEKDKFLELVSHDIMKLGPCSQHFIFFLAYECSKLAKVFFNGKLF